MTSLLHSYLKSALLIVTGSIIFASPSHANINDISFSSGPALQQALIMSDHLHLYDGKHANGFGFAGGFYSGAVLDNSQALNYIHNISEPWNNSPKVADLVGGQHVYALLLDGKYDFNYDAVEVGSWHPYLMGGLGAARYGQPMATSITYISARNGDMVPLFRMGGGMAYHLGHQWDMSLDYKAGFSTANSSVYMAGGPQSANLQTVNMGMHYQF